MSGKKFVKNEENFTCLVCREKVVGTGYTDHCPHCLWSQHVDIYPGDRKSECQGLMKPLGATLKNGSWRLFYQCQKCNYTHPNKATEGDNMEIIIKLSTQPC